MSFGNFATEDMIVSVRKADGQPWDRLVQPRRRAHFREELAEAKPIEPLPPEDPEGEAGQCWNKDRAQWASLALQCYTIVTGSDLETAIRDLLGDMGHFCDRHGMDMHEEIEAAARMYDEETNGEGGQFDAK